MIPEMVNGITRPNPQVNYESAGEEWDEVLGVAPLDFKVNGS